MYVDPKATIAGLPSLVVRSFLRDSRSFQWSVHHAADRLRVPPRRAARVLKELIALGYVGRVDDKDTPFVVTTAGGRLGLASAARPLRRRTAEKKLAEFLDRVRGINADDHYLFWVERVIVFGSFLTGAERLNDVDVAVELACRIIDPQERWEAKQARIDEARARGRQFRNMGDEASWPEDEVLYALKARSRTIKIHRIDDEVLKHTTTRLVYSRENSGESNRP